MTDLPTRLRNQLIRLSADEELSPEFREACRRELGDRRDNGLNDESDRAKVTS